MEELYDELRKKHSLPDFKQMDAEFEISSIEEESFLLRNVRKKVLEKIEFSIKLLDDILHPESGVASYRESTIFEKSEQDHVLRLYKQLMYYNRLSVELTFSDSDESNAEFINQFMKDWPNLKKDILLFVRKLKECWRNEIMKKEVVGYLG
ncbi:hypothetical protein ACFL3V_04125 [Nanoarchaeota archaeon]